MNGFSSARSGVLSGYRSLAHVIAGLEFFAVVAFFAGVVLNTDLPSWQVLGDVVVAALLVVAAYPVGLVVDSIATKLWRLIGRQFNDPSKLRVWNARRTNHPAPGDPPETAADLRRGSVWLRAQRWIWTSEGARAEFGDLRIRMMIGKDTALNALLAWFVCMAGLLSLPARSLETGYDLGGIPGYAVIVGVVLFAALTAVLLSPREDVGRSWNWSDLRFWLRWIGGILAVFTTLLFLSFLWTSWEEWGYTQDPFLFELEPASFPLWVWLAGGTALGPWVVFAFVYVRLGANQLYLGLIRESAQIDPP